MSFCKEKSVVQCPKCTWSHQVNANGILPDGTYKSPCLNCTNTIKFKAVSDPKSQVSLTINGKLYTVPNTLKGSTSLNEFIRDHAGLRGTKNMCFVGGCGSCVVTVSHYDPSSQKKVTYAVNSCLCPVFSCDGFEVITTEGLGGKRTGFNPIQAKLADNNGSQCGWCSPGMVMNMHGFLSENPKPTQQDIEDAFSGQICRCTGYRNILNAMRSFATDAPNGNPIDIEDLSIKNGTCPGTCFAGGNNNVQEISKEAVVQTQDAQWYQPTSLDQTLNLMKQLKGKKYGLVFGSTGNGIYRDEYYDIYVNLRHVKELHDCNLSCHPVEIGANTTLAKLVEQLQGLSKISGYEYCSVLAEHVLKVANVPVRNAGCVAGNLMIKKNHPEFPSDIFVILETIGASVMIADANTGVAKEYSLLSFMEESMSDKIITSIKMPKSSDVIHTYKVMPNSQNSHAYVSGGFRMNIDSSAEFRVLTKPSIVYSGINDSFVHASKTESYLVGKTLNDQGTISAAIEVLKSEVNPVSREILASPEYRRDITVALFYRYVLQVLGSGVPVALKSGSSEISRGLSSGSVSYGTQKEMWPVSQPMPKVTARLQAAGEAVYTMDIPPIEGELHAALVVTTEGNAKISNIDPSEALKIPGVVKFLSASDIPGINSFMPTNLGFTPEEILCSGEVLYAGQALGMIVAETESIANAAASAVKVAYSDVKSPILTVPDAIAKKSFFPKPGGDLVVGDAEGAISKSAVVVEGEITLDTQYHMNMETQTCLAVPTEEGFEIHAATQWTDLCQQAVAQALNINNSDVHVSVRRLGGAYGSKITRNAQIASACAIASNALSRPVRLHLHLDTNMQMIGKRNPYLVKYQAGVTKDGKLNGMNISYFADEGCSVNDSPADSLSVFADNVYSCDNWHLVGYAVRTNCPSHTWCRAPVSYEAVLVTESIMEHLAFKLGKDPTDIKQMNLYKKGQVTPLGQPLTYCNIDTLMNQLLDSANYKARMEQMETYNKENRWKKRGLSVVPMKFAIGYGSDYFNVYVTIYNGDGSVVITHGGIECGQGINTKVIQVAAYELGIPMSLIRVRPTETLSNSNTASTGGSITSELCCKAVIDCCKELKARIQPVKEKAPELGWKELIQKCFSESVDLATRYWDVPKSKTPFMYCTYGVTCSEVELDVLTGERNITRVDLLHDCGNSINPEIDVGQIHGAFVMGIGHCFMEKTTYNSATGQNLSDTTWEYHVPMSKDIPQEFNVSLLKDAPNPVGILGSKAVGEPPQLMACSVLFALKHAIAAARLDSGNVDYFATTLPTTVDITEQLCLNKSSKLVIH